ncbi:MAG: hypothetical protein OJF48_002911 [Afipia sp.]|nr:MAG: hypothetical protein OJF48_002911 [Afipia sp.]
MLSTGRPQEWNSTRGTLISSPAFAIAKKYLHDEGANLPSLKFS